MKVLITIPRAVYDRLLRLCKAASWEYQILTSTVSANDVFGDENNLYVFCDSDEAKKLLSWVISVDPDAAGEIAIDQEPTKK